MRNVFSIHTSPSITLFLSFPLPIFSLSIFLFLALIISLLPHSTLFCLIRTLCNVFSVFHFVCLLESSIETEKVKKKQIAWFLFDLAHVVFKPKMSLRYIAVRMCHWKTERSGLTWSWHKRLYQPPVNCTGQIVLIHRTGTERKSFSPLSFVAAVSWASKI